MPVPPSPTSSSVNAPAPPPGRRRPLAAGTVLFPAATLYAIVAIPLWLYTQTSPTSSSWPIATAFVHAHEMLFGYALAVVAGFLISKTSPAWLAALFLCWIAARGAPFFVAETSLIVGVPNLLFAGLVAYGAAPMFMRAAKKAENRVIGPLLIAICACPLLYRAGVAGLLPGAQHRALLLAVDLLALLMLLMGGRAISPAVAGHHYRRGEVLQARVQPRLERLMILFMLAGAACDLVPGATVVSGACAIAAAATTAMRAWRWRLWTVLDRPELWSLGLGYLWLILGLVLKGLAQTVGALSLTHALHGLTVGALGTLTLTMMARTHTLRQRHPLERFGDVGAGAVLISLAALLRLGAPYATTPGDSILLLWGAGIAWAAAMALLLRRLLGFAAGGSGRHSVY
ncbi:MAG: NnrS family protein [Gammaproteobacteria bacterium]|nr:NnrS family protein [Gammaproteobacteria bacterium]